MAYSCLENDSYVYQKLPYHIAASGIYRVTNNYSREVHQCVHVHACVNYCMWTEPCTCMWHWPHQQLIYTWLHGSIKYVHTCTHVHCIWCALMVGRIWTQLHVVITIIKSRSVASSSEAYVSLLKSWLGPGNKDRYYAHIHVPTCKCGQCQGSQTVPWKWSTMLPSVLAVYM